MRFLGVVLFCLAHMIGHGQKDEAQLWVDSVYQQMDVEERIGQLLMIRAHSNLGRDHIATVRRYIEEYQVGGLCFFQGTPEKQSALTKEYQQRSKIPLLVSMDAEWGTGMRFKEDGYSFPRQLTLGASEYSNITRRMGHQIGMDLRSLGVHLNFAPVVDVNNNPDNPVIHTRSFGENPERVSQHAINYMKGLHAARVAACAKHFPGHGDTDVDSHHDLPVIQHDRKRLDSIELTPFKRMIDADVPAIMVAHLQVPAIDDHPNRPTTLSRKAVQGLLREELGFEGVIITDAMEMKGVTKHYPPGRAEALAIMAGNDMICLPASVPRAFEAIKTALDQGEIPASELEDHVKRILKLKYALGLFEDEDSTESHPIPTNEKDLTKEQIYRQSITCVRNIDNWIPVKRRGDGLMASVSIGSDQKTPFQQQLQMYTQIVDFSVDRFFRRSSVEEMLNRLEVMDLVFVGMHDLNAHPGRNFGLTRESIRFLRELQKRTRVVVTVFGTPYLLSSLDFLDHILLAYEEDPIAQKVAAQMLFGAGEIAGKLPVTAKPFPVGSSFYIPDLLRLKWSRPEWVGMDSDSLARIDSLVHDLIREKAAPGCQVLVAKDRAVIYHKAFGFHTFKKTNPVLLTDIYDLASVTKVAATTLAIMKLHEEGKINVNKTLGRYLPEAKGTNKGGLIIKDILSHRAGLIPWIPFYKNTLDESDRPHKEIYSGVKKNPYSVPVAHNLYMNENYLDTIYQRIFDSKLYRKGYYNYSDLGLILLARVVKEVDGRSLDQYVEEEFYRPMGLMRTFYRPEDHFISRGSIVPTEEDRYFRYQTLRGDVHDMGAAMLGGVSGHAGLFSNAAELAAIFQMLLNRGVYGGVQYLSDETITYFTTRVPGATRRGIGFDLKQLNRRRKENVAEEASINTFGHLGFTGIAAWADPKEHLIYLFLSNRTYPSMDNKKLAKENYRIRIQSAVYKALIHRSSS